MAICYDYNMGVFFKRPLFWGSAASLVFTLWLIAGLAFGWTNPTANPPGGTGAISVNSLGNVGVGTAAPNSSKGGGGYVDAKDLFLRDVNQWASQDFYTSCSWTGWSQCGGFCTSTNGSCNGAYWTTRLYCENGRVTSSSVEWCSLD